MRLAGLTLTLLFSSLALGLLTACEPATPPAANKTIDGVTIAPFPSKAFAEQTGLSLRQLHRQAAHLINAVNAFLQHNDQQHWQRLREQWLANHQQWHHSDFYLQAYPVEQRLIAKLHSTPISPGYLDHIEGYPHSGIVHDSSLHLTLDTIGQQHRLFSDEEASLGIHVLEFLIWGRQLTDYTQGRDINQAQTLKGLKQNQLPTPRRREFLRLVAEQWQHDIETLDTYWQEHSAQLRTRTPESLGLFLSQQIGRLAGNTHNLYSKDLNWQIGILNAINIHIKTNDDFSKTLLLIKQLNSHDKIVSEEDYATLNQQLGALMLSTLNNSKPIPTSEAQ